MQRLVHAASQEKPMRLWQPFFKEKEKRKGKGKGKAEGKAKGEGWNGRLCGRR